MLTTSTKKSLAALILILGACGGVAVEASPSIRFIGQKCRYTVGGPERDCAAKMGETLNVLDFYANGVSGAAVDPTGVVDSHLGIQAAINGLPSTGGRIFFPIGIYNLGTAGITVAQGSNAVQLVGEGMANGAGIGGARLKYTGTGAAIDVGSAAGDTTNFRLENIYVDVSGAGNNNKGVRLTRVVTYHISDLRYGASSSATGQRGVDLEGDVNYTGGLLENSWFSMGPTSTAIYLGKNANANTFINNYMAGVTSSSIGYDFVGDAAGQAGGNAILGGDIENALVAIRMDYASHNSAWGARVEACGKTYTDTANSGYNYMNFNTNGVNNDKVTTSGINVNITDAYTWQVRPGSSGYLVKLKNTDDVPTAIVWQAGATTQQQIEMDFASISSTGVGTIYRTTSNSFVFGLDYKNYYNAALNGLNSINSYGSNQVAVNADTNAGTGGLQVWSGGASPSLQIQLRANGYITITSTPFASLSGGSNNGSITYCGDCTIANPCAGGGTGAIAKRLNGVWVCN